MRLQMRRQRGDILRLQRAAVDTASAEGLRLRMPEKVYGLCAERERLSGGERLKRPTYASGKIINGPTARR